MRDGLYFLVTPSSSCGASSKDAELGDILLVPHLADAVAFTGCHGDYVGRCSLGMQAQRSTSISQCAFWTLGETSGAKREVNETVMKHV